MRFMIMLMATRETEAGLPLLVQDSEMDRFHELLSRDDALIAADRLMPSSAGLRVSCKPAGEGCTVEAGPFDEGRMLTEVMVVEADSIEEVLERVVGLGRFAGGGGLEVEIRVIRNHAAQVEDRSASAMEAELRDQMSMLNNRRGVKL
ncbi:hypothetical protein [Paenibacillus soyae]|uniref:YCII-related domain-containing protein n=1 Tax=Paenibacillus soyae TaxID=2969249 RepID=A0A9X2MT11_9BACL|nr:hypothetical protein [Paenibacillus soyae]MCR2805920.1 hypothetical protein [Paenibacillus soyae]